MERPVKVPGPDGRLMDGFEVPIAESTERRTEIKLEDGSVIRVGVSILSAVRIPGMWDQDGNPMYFLKANNMMTVVEASEQFKKPAQTVPQKAN